MLRLSMMTRPDAAHSAREEMGNRGGAGGGRTCVYDAMELLAGFVPNRSDIDTLRERKHSENEKIRLSVLKM